MILILCNSYREACKAFRIFLDILDDNEPWSIQNLFEEENCIEIDDDLRYMFIDRRVVHVFDRMKPDIEELSTFLEGLARYHYSDESLMEYYDYIF